MRNYIKCMKCPQCVIYFENHRHTYWRNDIMTLETLQYLYKPQCDDMAQSDNMGFHFIGEQHKLMNVPKVLRVYPKTFSPKRQQTNKVLTTPIILNLYQLSR